LFEFHCLTVGRREVSVRQLRNRYKGSRTADGSKGFTLVRGKRGHRAITAQGVGRRASTGLSPGSRHAATPAPEAGIPSRGPSGNTRGLASPSSAAIARALGLSLGSPGGHPLLAKDPLPPPLACPRHPRPQEDLGAPNRTGPLALPRLPSKRMLHGPSSFTGDAVEASLEWARAISSNSVPSGLTSVEQCPDSAVPSSEYPKAPHLTE
jgi:hypothetical protein